MNNPTGESASKDFFSIPDKYAEGRYERLKGRFSTLLTDFIFPMRNAMKISGSEYNRITPEYFPQTYIPTMPDLLRKVFAWGDVIFTVGSVLSPHTFLVPKLISLLAPSVARLGVNFGNRYYPSGNTGQEGQPTVVETPVENSVPVNPAVSPA